MNNIASYTIGILVFDTKYVGNSSKPNAKFATNGVDRNFPFLHMNGLQEMRRS